MRNCKTANGKRKINTAEGLKQIQKQLQTASEYSRFLPELYLLQHWKFDIQHSIFKPPLGEGQKKGQRKLISFAFILL
jgi:hypothetical protein